MIILRPPERGQDLTINHPSQPIKLIGTAGALSGPGLLSQGRLPRPRRHFVFVLEKLLRRAEIFHPRPAVFVFPFPSLIFLFKEPAPAVLDGGENDINTSPTALSSASVNFFYFFSEAFLPALAGGRRLSAA